MNDPLGIANRNIWLIARPYIILLWLWCMAASMFGLLIATVALWVIGMYAMALGCAVGMLFLLAAGMAALVMMYRDDEIEQIYIEVHC